ncbi:MAG: hypothetical protein PVH62_04070 [Anaerolineae bacterium]|jgi:hypothetical protein
MTLDLFGGMVGMLLTILILSYFVGDNPLYRLALHLLVGASVGYAVAVVTFTVMTRAVLPAFQGSAAQHYGLLVAVLLGVLLLFKAVPQWAPYGNLSTAFLLGVGAAVAVGGALLGTILPQTTATGSLADWRQLGSSDLINGLVVAGGTICALLAFTFTVRRQQGLRGLWGALIGFAGRIGRAFLLVAFGAAFAGALTASLSVLIGRVYALVEGVQNLLLVFGG